MDLRCADRPRLFGCSALSGSISLIAFDRAEVTGGHTNASSCPPAFNG